MDAREGCASVRPADAPTPADAAIPDASSPCSQVGSKVAFLQGFPAFVLTSASLGGCMSESTGPLKKTPLNEVEKQLGGKMVDFGGWELPVQFGGILEEHDAVRNDVGVFDVSHMGEITVRGPQALELLQRATCNDVAKLVNGRAQYTGLLYPNATFVDDILIYQIAPDDFFLVVNASNADKDFEWLRKSASGLDV